MRHIPIILFGFGLSSCGLLPNCRQTFVLHREPLLTGAAHVPRLNGYYVSVGSDGFDAFALFTGGKVKMVSGWHPNGTDFWNNPQAHRAALVELASLVPREGWGVYSIRDNTILIQSFNHNLNEPCVRSVYEERGIVINDTTITISSLFMHWRQDTLISSPNTYRFYPMDQVPDPSSARLYRRGWYKRDLHPSRR